MIEITSSAECSGLMMALYIIMNICPMLLLFIAIKKRKEGKKTPGTLIVSSILMEIAICLIASITEQYRIATVGGIKATIMWWQFGIEIVFATALFVISSKTTKLIIPSVFLLGISGFLLSNYGSYYIAVLTMANNHTVALQIVLGIIAIICVITSIFSFLLGENIQVQPKDKEKEKENQNAKADKEKHLLHRSDRAEKKETNSIETGNI